MFLTSVAKLDFQGYCEHQPSFRNIPFNIRRNQVNHKDSVRRHSYIEMSPNNLNMSDNILFTTLGQKHLPLVNDKLISPTHRESISHFKPSYTGHVANLWVYNINNSENFIIFSSGFLYFLHFKNLFWHTESYMVAESNKLVNLFFFLLQHHDSGKKSLRNLIEIVTDFIEEQNLLFFWCLIIACMSLYF